MAFHQLFGWTVVDDCKKVLVCLGVRNFHCFEHQFMNLGIVAKTYLKSFYLFHVQSQVIWDVHQNFVICYKFTTWRKKSQHFFWLFLKQVRSYQYRLAEYLICPRGLKKNWSCQSHSHNKTCLSQLHLKQDCLAMVSQLLYCVFAFQQETFHWLELMIRTVDWQQVLDHLMLNLKQPSLNYH